MENTKLVAGLYNDLSDELYHAQHGEGEHYFSSSQLKTMLDSPYAFRKKYIYGECEEISTALQSAFDIGSYFHCAILEPEKLSNDFVIFSGRKAGKAWEQFKEDNAGKTILNAGQMKQATTLIEAVKASDTCAIYLEDIQAEVSLFAEYAGIKGKVRADALGYSFINDLKSMAGNPRDVSSILKKIDNLHYDMSAAYYIDMFNEYFESIGSERRLTQWVWTFASKDEGSAQVYIASPKMLAVGRAKVRKAIALINKYSALGWEIPEEVITLDPKPFVVSEWMKEEPKQFSRTQQPVTNLSDLL